MKTLSKRSHKGRLGLELGVPVAKVKEAEKESYRVLELHKARKSASALQERSTPVMF